MRVLAARSGDVVLPGGTTKAVIPGQSYELPDDVASAGIAMGLLTATKAQEPVTDKAVRPVTDKATPAPHRKRDLS